MEEASRCLAASEAGAKKQARAAKSLPSKHRFDAGMEWEIMHADAVVLLGLTHVLRYAYPCRHTLLFTVTASHTGATCSACEFHVLSALSIQLTLS
jgi:hypothetical protein